jgi:chlorobactene glucosyltransferase
MVSGWALVATLPWVVIPPLAMLRVARSRSLAEESSSPPSSAPLLSVVVPARNEARNIARCVRSLLASTYPALELIVVDDHSTDGTGDIAHDVAAGDRRFRLIQNPPLPNGWFGKQWACATGAAAATGRLLLFTDADTLHGPELATRAVNAMVGRQAALLSVAGRQETHSFWERLLQPQILWILLARYGGTESVSNARRPEDVIANGQFMLVRREAYDEIGGHAAVRDKVAEDLALAQRFFRAGYRVVLVRAEHELSTHMYASLRELIDGWGKNVFAGGIDAMPGGAVGRLLFPFVLPLIPLMALAPWFALGAAIAGLLGNASLVWSVICVLASLIWWALIYRGFEQSVLLALLYPVGAAVVLYVMLRAIARGRRVGWKGRQYVAR